MNQLRIAFVANNKNPALFMADPAFIYRCENLALALQNLGHEVTLMHISELKISQYFDFIVLHRPKKNFITYWILRALKRKGSKVLADFDDLVFLPEFAQFSPGVVNNLVSLQQTKKKFSSHQSAIDYCHACIVSVKPLQEKFNQFIDKPTLLLHNAVHQSWYPLNVSPERIDRPKLTYFPGTRSHDRDFATIKDMLEEVLHEEQDLILQITGLLNTDIRCRKNQIITYPKVLFKEYVSHVAQSWLNLAPLENTVFNHHKSALKAIEASWFNAPTLATPIPDMERLQTAGAELMVSQDDWYRAIKAMLNKTYYQAKQQGLRQKLLANTSIENNAQTFLNFVANL